MNDWDPILQDELNKEYFKALQEFISDERYSKKRNIFLPVDKVFSAFHLTSLEKIKVVILGQDPYHGAGQAHGLAFSVPNGISIPPIIEQFLSA